MLQFEKIYIKFKKITKTLDFFVIICIYVFIMFLKRKLYIIKKWHHGKNKSYFIPLHLCEDIKTFVLQNSRKYFLMKNALSIYFMLTFAKDNKADFEIWLENKLEDIINHERK